MDIVNIAICDDNIEHISILEKYLFEISNIKIIGMDFLSFFDFISNSVLMPIVAFLICIFVGYVIKPQAIIEEAQAEGQKFSAKGLFTVVIRYIAPICIVLILISSVLDAMGIMKI